MESLSPPRFVILNGKNIFVKMYFTEAADPDLNFNYPFKERVVELLCAVGNTTGCLPLPGDRLAVEPALNELLYYSIKSRVFMAAEPADEWTGILPDLVVQFGLKPEEY